jgi:hypothetical protein
LNGLLNRIWRRFMRSLRERRTAGTGNREGGDEERAQETAPDRTTDDAIREALPNHLRDNHHKTIPENHCVRC